MTVEPKLLSEENLSRMINLWSSHIAFDKLIAHIVALDQQIAAKNAEIERLREALRNSMPTTTSGRRHAHESCVAITSQIKGVSHG